jgi:hypothetical protein
MGTSGGRYGDYEASLLRASGNMLTLGTMKSFFFEGFFSPD